LRSSLSAMQQTARRLYEEQSLLPVENKIAPIDEVFRLQDEAELKAAERKYLPVRRIVQPTITAPNGNHSPSEEEKVPDQPIAQKTQYTARSRTLSFKRLSRRIRK